MIVLFIIIALRKPITLTHSLLHIGQFTGLIIFHPTNWYLVGTGHKIIIIPILPLNQCFPSCIVGYYLIPKNI